MARHCAFPYGFRVPTPLSSAVCLEAGPTARHGGKVMPAMQNQLDHIRTSSRNHRFFSSKSWGSYKVSVQPSLEWKLSKYDLGMAFLVVCWSVVAQKKTLVVSEVRVLVFHSFVQCETIFWCKSKVIFKPEISLGHDIVIFIKCSHH